MFRCVHARWAYDSASGYEKTFAWACSRARGCARACAPVRLCVCASVRARVCVSACERSVHPRPALAPRSGATAVDARRVAAAQRRGRRRGAGKQHWRWGVVVSGWGV
eukprot:6173572-Pleurochrysis_carterae.AAC.1